ncbi:MAG: hypothetical protein HND51_09905 [Chloroflexi bacterium]|nr:hypothetical protein [Chloroflexota bacterium]
MTLAAHRQEVAEATLGAFPTRLAGEPGKIAYEASEVLESSAIFVMNPDGSDQTLLVSGDNGVIVGSPAWSPDGKFLAYTCNNHLCVVNFDGSGYRQVTESTSNRYFPNWLPDGNLIAFGKINKEIVFNVHTLDVASGSEELVLPGAYAASWSPDGTHIAFLKLNDDLQNEMYVRSIQGGNDVKIWDFEVETFAWSSDGEYLLLSAKEEKSTLEHEIYVIHPDGSGVVKLTENDWDDIYPVWSPDSTQIAFSSKQFGNYDIFVMNVNGSNVQQLTTSVLDETAPSWQPDQE